MRKALSFLVLAVFLFTSGCGMMEDLGDALSGIAADIDVDVDTESELGENTLERIDAINETIATGVEVGPETRDLIRELNETLKNGLKAGFDDETLARLDELLRVVEDGLKIGLDDDTLATIDGMVETIDRMPGNWEASAQDIINTLENTAGSTAGRLAEEVKGVINEARVNYQQMTAITGIEFRCNVDFLGSKIGATAQEFIGKSIVGKLKSIVTGEEMEKSVPIPWVCQVIPEMLTLSKVGDQMLFSQGIITLTGYNYVAANTPVAQVVDESGAPVAGVSLYPYLASPYQVQLNLQQLDFSKVPARSRIVFKWPNVDESSGVAILMPDQTGPIADFSMDKSGGPAPLTVQFTDTSSGSPTEWMWVFGDGTTDHSQNPAHTYTTGRDFQVQLTVKNALGQSSVIKSVAVGTALVADFTFSKVSIEEGELVKFTDKSTGAPNTWQWDFGDGSATSDEQSPDHVFLKSNPDGYVVTLTVSNGTQTATKTSTNRIKVMEPIDAIFTTDATKGNPPFEVKFTDESLGGSSIMAWVWDFGDGSAKSYDQHPKHTYTKFGNHEVTLTISRVDGKSDTATANINAWTTLMTLQRTSTKFILSPSLKDNSVYFPSFTNLTGGTPVNTNISSQKYVCGVVGFSAINGIMWPFRTQADGLRIYMYPYDQKWWLMAEFQDIDIAYYGKEKWSVNVMCLSRDLEGSVFVYRDDYGNISGGTPQKTDISTENYFHCGIFGTVGKSVTGFKHGWYSTIALDQTLDESGDVWKINSDMDVTDGGDDWNVNIFCLKDNASYLNVEEPTFVTRTVAISTGISNENSTDISANEYICGVDGYKAERTAMYAADPMNAFDVRNIAPDLLTVRTYPKNGYWWVYANIANRTNNEDWKVDLLCVRKGFAVEGTPPS